MNLRFLSVAIASNKWNLKQGFLIMCDVYVVKLILLQILNSIKNRKRKEE